MLGVNFAGTVGKARILVDAGSALIFMLCMRGRAIAKPGERFARPVSRVESLQLVAVALRLPAILPVQYVFRAG
ncbi:hypothetical protein ACUXIL_001138 [Ralstonia pickettii]